MDHTSKGWTCFHLYMHDGCVAGYVCNHTSGQCMLGAPGTGDTKSNCEFTCLPPAPPAPPPPPRYTCNATTFTCEISPSGKTDKGGCSSACSNSTPSELVGIWRGLDVQKDFAAGEYVMNFSTHAVSYGPLASPRQFAAAVATISRTLVRLTYTAPASLAGSVMYATYSTPGWPTGPETRAVAIALQKGGHQAPPTDVTAALGDKDFGLYVLSGCNPWKSRCDFASAFAPPVALGALGGAQSELRARSGEVAALSSPRLFGAMVDDKCTVHSTCDACIDDPLKVTPAALLPSHCLACSAALLPCC